MTEHEELKPCPWCGGKASSPNRITYTGDHEAWFADGTRIVEAWHINCVKCGNSNKGLCGHQTPADATEFWNRRAS